MSVVNDIYNGIKDWIPNIAGALVGLFASQIKLVGFSTILCSLLAGVAISIYGGDLINMWYKYDSASNEANAIEFIVGVFGLTFTKLAFTKLPTICDLLVNKIGEK